MNINPKPNIQRVKLFDNDYPSEEEMDLHIGRIQEVIEQRGGKWQETFDNAWYTYHYANSMEKVSKMISGGELWPFTEDEVLHIYMAKLTMVAVLFRKPECEASAEIVEELRRTLVRMREEGREEVKTTIQ